MSSPITPSPPWFNPQTFSLLRLLPLIAMPMIPRWCTAAGALARSPSPSPRLGAPTACRLLLDAESEDVAVDAEGVVIVLLRVSEANL